MDVNVTAQADAPAPALTPASPYRRALRRRLWMVGAFALAGAGAGYFYAAGLPKSYTAAGTISVEGGRGAAGAHAAPGAEPSPAAMTPDLMPWVRTEVQALSSRALVLEVADRLHLDQDPGFAAALRQPGAKEDVLFAAASRALSVTQDGASLVIGAAFTSDRPQLSADFVNTLFKTEIDGRAARRAEASPGVSAAETARIAQVRQDVDSIEKKMRDLRESPDFVGLRAGSIGPQQIEDLAVAAARATAQRNQLEASVPAGGRTISRLRQTVSAASARVSDLSRSGADEQALRSAQAELTSSRRALSQETRRAASLTVQLAAARAHETEVSAQLDQARHAIVTAQNIQAQLDQLAQDAASRRDLYRTLVERAQQEESQPPAPAGPDLRILSNAAPPGVPSAPNMTRAAGLCGLGGGVLGCLVALITAVGASRRFDPDAFALLPNVSVIARLRRAAVTGGNLAERVLSAPDGLEAEALRGGCVQLRQVGRYAPHIVGFAGSLDGAGNAGAAAAFARVAAMDGLRVLLVDNGAGAALAQALRGHPGHLGAILAGEADWRDCLVADRVPSLDLLINDGYAADEAEAGRVAVGFENLLAEARDEYDMIVLAAAEGAGSHAALVARRSDITVLLVDTQSLDQTGAAEAVGRAGALSRSPVAAILLTRQG